MCTVQGCQVAAESWSVRGAGSDQCPGSSAQRTRDSVGGWRELEGERPSGVELEGGGGRWRASGGRVENPPWPPPDNTNAHPDISRWLDIHMHMHMYVAWLRCIVRSPATGPVRDRMYVPDGDACLGALFASGHAVCRPVTHTHTGKRADNGGLWSICARQPFIQPLLRGRERGSEQDR